MNYHDQLQLISMIGMCMSELPTKPCGCSLGPETGVRCADMTHLAEIEKQQNRIRKDPGGRIGAADAGKADSSNQHKGDKNTCDQFRNPCQHGFTGVTHPLQAVTENEDNCERGIECTHDHKIPLSFTEYADLRRIHKKQSDLLACKIVEKKGSSTVKH